MTDAAIKTFRRLVALTQGRQSREVSCFVPGLPKGQPRAKTRHRAFHAGGAAHAYTPGTAEHWKSQIAIAAQPFIPTPPHPGPVFLLLEHVMPRPAGHFRKDGSLKPSAPVFHLSTPDFDNLAKVAADALQAVGMWRNDAAICFGASIKRYADPDERQGAWLHITLMNDNR